MKTLGNMTVWVSEYPGALDGDISSRQCTTTKSITPWKVVPYFNETTGAELPYEKATMTCDTPIGGSYVTIKQDPDKLMGIQLEHVSVGGQPSPSPLTAVGASMSSTFSSTENGIDPLSAENCIDNLKYPLPNQELCGTNTTKQNVCMCHTANYSDDWLCIHLETSSEVASVVVHTRSDYRRTMQDMGNMTVWVSDAPGALDGDVSSRECTTTKSITPWEVVPDYTFVNDEWTVEQATMTCDTPIGGSYVTIKQDPDKRIGIQLEHVSVRGQPDALAGIERYRTQLEALNKEMFFMIYTRNAVSAGQNAKLCPYDEPNCPLSETFWANSWDTDTTGRDFFMRLIRGMGHGYVHANAGKPVNWYDSPLYTPGVGCADLLDPDKNTFTTKNFGKGYDVDGIFEYGQGDGLIDKKMKFTSLGYNGGWMTIPVWEYYIRRNGTLRHHFRDFIDFVGTSFPSGTITAVDLFNEILDCNFQHPSGFLQDEAFCTQAFPHVGHLPQDYASCDLYPQRRDYFEILAEASERSNSSGVTKEDKRQLWCELALRVRAQWGAPLITYNDYNLEQMTFQDDGTQNCFGSLSTPSTCFRAKWASHIIQEIAATSLDQSQIDSLPVGAYNNDANRQCHDAIDAVGMQSHESCPDTAWGSGEEVDTFIKLRMNIYRHYATLLHSSKQNKTLEVHLTEVDFAKCTTDNVYNYHIDNSTKRPISTYHDAANTTKYAEFYTFAHALFTSCLASQYCTKIIHWGTWGE
jgi:hypothetical protein